MGDEKREHQSCALLCVAPFLPASLRSFLSYPHMLLILYLHLVPLSSCVPFSLSLPHTLLSPQTLKNYHR